MFNIVNGNNCTKRTDHLDTNNSFKKQKKIRNLESLLVKQIKTFKRRWSQHFPLESSSWDLEQRKAMLFLSTVNTFHIDVRRHT